MNLRFAVLCDAANESKENKINILGEFNTIFAENLPVRWPRMVVVARFEAHSVEGVIHNFRIALTDEDGQAIFGPTDEVPLNFAAQGKGLPLRGQVIIHLDGLPFERYGSYSFQLMVDGQVQGSVPIRVQPRGGPPLTKPQAE